MACCAIGSLLFVALAAVLRPLRRLLGGTSADSAAGWRARSGDSPAGARSDGTR